MIDKIINTKFRTAGGRTAGGSSAGFRKKAAAAESKITVFNGCACQTFKA